jgi:hypothetical protein
MSGFEYLVSLASVVAGLGLTRALSGLAKIIHLRQKIRFSGVHFAWTGSILLWLISYWWFTFLFASLEQWTIPLFLFVLIYGAAIYFLIALLYPEDLDSGISLFEYFLDNRQWFFGAFVGLGVVDIADAAIKTHYGYPPPPMWLGFIAVWIVMGVIGVITANHMFHRAFAYGWLVVSTLFAVTSISGALTL